MLKFSGEYIWGSISFCGFPSCLALDPCRQFILSKCIFIYSLPQGKADKYCTIQDILKINDYCFFPKKVFLSPPFILWEEVSHFSKPFIYHHYFSLCLTDCAHYNYPCPIVTWKMPMTNLVKQHQMVLCNSLWLS